MMKKSESSVKHATNRRAFLTTGMVAAGAATMGAALLPGTSAAFGREEDDHAPITKGDIAILTFLSALEQVEADLWIQYAELGGATNQGLSTFSMATCRSTSRTIPTTKSATTGFSIITSRRRVPGPST